MDIFSRTSFLSLNPAKQRQSLFSSGVRLIADVRVNSPPLSHFSFFASRSSPSGVPICFMCSGPLLTISSPPPAHEGAWTERVVNLWNSGEVRLGGRVKLVGFWVKICLVPCHFRSTTNLGVWWRVLSCGDSSVPDLFFIVVFLSSKFGRSGAVARDAFLRLASRRRRLVWLPFRWFLSG